MKIYLILFFCALCNISLAQEIKVETEIYASHVYDLSVIGIYPDSFPQVSVIFQAQDENEEPIWEIDKSELQIEENSRSCEVIDIHNISKNKIFNIGLVLDHSGSMLYNSKYVDQNNSGATYEELNDLLASSDYISSLDYAKEGIYEFLNEKDHFEDSILFVGFSSTVDSIHKPTNNPEDIKNQIKDLEPGGGTAFYDALYESISIISRSQNTSVIIALTDGKDYSRRHTLDQVIDLANKHQIKVYIIGLGDANEAPLKKVTSNTGGYYYYTNDAEALKDIYLKIKRQIKSIYQVDYISPSDDYLEDHRTIRFSFVNDTLTFSNDSIQFALPQETVTYLKEKEEERKEQEKQRNLMLFGGLGIVILGIGSYRIYNRENPIQISEVYPNPFENTVHINFQIPPESNNAIINVSNVNGYLVYKRKLSPGDTEKRMDLRNLKPGVYFVQITNDNGESETVKIVKN